MWVIGVVVVLVGAGFLWSAVRAQRSVHAMLAAETLSVPELEELRRVSDDLGARGSFRKVCEVVGAAHPSPEGVLRSELSGVECVWHSHRVQRRYKHYDRDRDGSTRVTTRTETVAEQTSGLGFALLRDGRTIGVDHAGRRPDGVEQVTDRFEQTQEPSNGWADVVGALVGSDRDETIGYQYTEWVLRPGTPMYVLGEVHDAIGPLVIAPPADPKQPFVMSTSTEQQLTDAARGRQRFRSRLGAALVVVGIVVVVLALVL
ncbi:GIDE domain-containing protein [Pseudonocardia benzenivorans]|uniref:RING-type E3 ubiquitin transferase n=1 Tax=Pseudonocardia benzenivorans TaxID=228005 RepID=A0ABW3VBI9_9PSEU